MAESSKDNIFNQIEACKRTTVEGSAYWMARDLLPILGYSRWENFVNVIDKARMACESAGVESIHQFREITKGIPDGKGAEVQRADFYLSRYACYLICMNGDTSKPEVGFAALKRIPPNEDLLDCIGRAELAANEFRITQTEAKLIREEVQSETNAVNTHFRVGKAVRKTIADLGGTMPEKLP